MVILGSSSDEEEVHPSESMIIGKAKKKNREESGRGNGDKHSPEKKKSQKGTKRKRSTDANPEGDRLH